MKPLIAKMTFKNNCKFFFPSAIILLVVIVVSIYGHTTQSKNPEQVNEPFFNGGFFILLCIVLPGLLLHTRYYLIDKSKTVLFNKNEIEITTNKIVQVIKYADILKVERHEISWKTRIPWAYYDYTKLFLKDGTTIKYTCLTLDSGNSHTQFVKRGVEINEVDEFYPW